MLFASPYDHLCIPTILNSSHLLSSALNLPFNISFYHPLREVPNAPILPFTCAPFVPSFTPHPLFYFLCPLSFEHSSPLLSSFPHPLSSLIYTLVPPLLFFPPFFCLQRSATGKTLAVHACAAQLGFTIIEMNSSHLRTMAAVKKQCAEGDTHTYYTNILIKR